MASSGERRAGSMTLRSQPRRRYEDERDDQEVVVSEFVYYPHAAEWGVGAGCAWRNWKWMAHAERWYPPVQLSRKKANRFDVVWDGRVGGRPARFGLHCVAQARSMKEQARLLRKGVVVKRGLAEFIPSGTWIPGGIIGLEYNEAEFERMKIVHSEDMNIQWALQHSPVSPPPDSTSRKSRRTKRYIIPDLRVSGIVILINHGDEPNCKLFAEEVGTGPAGRSWWKVSYKITKDVHQDQELIASYGFTPDMM